LSVVGNAKNAGKTTVLNALIAAYGDIRVGVTSIGLDGEELDAVTYLPKPRIYLQKGTLTATAEDCLKTAEATYRLLRRTGVSTALGEIVVVEIVKPGICLVGGPATVAAMEKIVGILKDLGAARIFIDGAFARSSHAVAGEALVYVVGAHYSPVMEKVVAAAGNALRRFRLPAVPVALQELSGQTEIGWIDRANGFHPLGMASTIGTADRILDQIPAAAAWLYLPKALGPVFARRFIERREENRCGLVLADPTALVLPDDVLRHLFQTGRDIRVLRPMTVAFVAINPFSPAGHRFDGERFLTSIRKVTDLPVIDVLEVINHGNPQ